MRHLQAAVWAEGLKAYRSVIFWITLLAFICIPLVLALLVFILKNPEFARKAGLLGAKAQLVGTADWPSYLDMMIQMISVVGIVGFGFVASWVFGREYSDRTVKDLLALPAPRSVIVVAKFITMSAWCALLSLILFGLGLAAGHIVILPGWSGRLLADSTWAFAVASLLTIVLSTPVAFFASYGQGYLAPMGFVIGTLFVSQFAAVLGYGAYVPWAVPALFSGAAGPEQAQLGAVSYLIVLVTGGLGLVGTLLWWGYADQA